MESTATRHTTALSLASNSSLVLLGRMFEVEASGEKTCGIIADIAIETVDGVDSLLITVEQSPVCSHGGFIAAQRPDLNPYRVYKADSWAPVHDHLDGSIHIWVPLVWRGTIFPA